MPAVFDVIVVGAGPAGITAATAAARSGASTLLLERTDAVGGTVTAAAHQCLCGLYATKPAAPDDTLNDGLQREVVRSLMAAAPTQTVVRQLGRTWVLEFDLGAWRASLSRLLDGEGIATSMGTTARQVLKSGHAIEGLIADNGERYLARAMVDCSGSGAILTMAGAAQPADETRALGGAIVRLDGVGEGELLAISVPYVLGKAAHAGEIFKEAAFTVFRRGAVSGEAWLKLALRMDEALAPTAAADCVMRVLRANVAEMARARVRAISPKVLPRDGRRLDGVSTLREEGIVSERKSKGVTAWWPMEYWSASDGPIYRYPEEGRAYEISEGTVRSRTINNLFGTGACLSATAMAASSARVAGVCLTTGEMAGRLAAAIAR